MGQLGRVLFAENLSPLTSNGVVQQHILSVYTVVFWTSVVFAVCVAGGILFTAVAFRARGRTEEPAQVSGDMRLEITWTVIPFIVLVGLFTLTAFNLPFITSAPKGAMQIKVVGKRYEWDYTYSSVMGPNGQPLSNQVDQLTIPANTAIELTVTSFDVNHSFYVPTLGGQINAIPGQLNHMWIEANVGTFHGECTELCGPGHDGMVIVVDSLSPSAWKAWVKQEHTPPKPVVTPSAIPATHATPSAASRPTPTSKGA